MNLPRRILVVDDDIDAIKAIRSQLIMFDFEVDDISDPTKVIDHLHTTNDYGLFILDVNMPGKDGITLASQIRSTFRSAAPILFISGDIGEETANRIRRLSLTGHVDYLQKGSYKSKDLFNQCTAMLKEHSASKTMQELTGRISHLQDNLGEGMARITEFMAEQRKLQSETPLVTVAHCDEKAKALINEIRRDAIGIISGKTNERIDSAFSPEVFEPKVAAVLDKVITPEIFEPKVTAVLDKVITPEKTLGLVRSSMTFKVALFFLGIIFSGLCIFWTTTWAKAEKAIAGFERMEIKNDQTIETVRAQTIQIQRLLSTQSTPISTS